MDFLVNSEIRKSDVEVVYKGNFDILIRKGRDGKPLDQELNKLISDNIDRNNTPFPPDWPNQTSRGGLMPFIHVDNSDNPRYIVKLRRLAREARAIIQERREGQEVISRFPKQAILAFNSLFNEMRMADRVKALLESQEGRNLSYRLGFSSITFVEPLLGVVDRKFKDKIMFYPYVKGINLADANAEEGERISAEVFKFFQDHGIEPYDLAPQQFIIGEGSTLETRQVYLIDIEGYTVRQTLQAQKPV